MGKWVKYTKTISSCRLQVGESVKFRLDPWAESLIPQWYVGFYRDQRFSNNGCEWLMCFYLGEHNGKFVFLGEPTSRDLILFGKAGYKHGRRAMDKICQELYGSSKTQAHAITRHEFEELPMHLKTDSVHWLAESRVRNGPRRRVAEIDYIDLCGVNSIGLYFEARGDLPSREECYGYAIRPLIKCSSDVIIDNDNRLWPVTTR